MALSQVMDVEVNPADVAGVCILYRLGTAEFSIALSALYQLLLLSPKQGCARPGCGSRSAPAAKRTCGRQCGLLGKPPGVGVGGMC